MKNEKKVFCYLITVLLFTCQLDVCLGDDCELEGVSETEWKIGYTNEAIEDTAVNVVIATFKATNVKDVDFGDNSNSNKYFRIVFENDLLEIFTDPKFEDFEIEETQTSTRFRLKFTCTSDFRDLIFFQPIIDTNNHAPSFDNVEYVYDLPMPFPPNFELTLLKEICATDIDITNRKLEFQIEETELLQITYKNSLNAKKHCASLKTKKQLIFERPHEFEIAVLDEGVPQKTGIAKLIINVYEKVNASSDSRFGKYDEGRYEIGNQ